MQFTAADTKFSRKLVIFTFLDHKTYLYIQKELKAQEILEKITTKVSEHYIVGWTD